MQRQKIEIVKKDGKTTVAVVLKVNIKKESDHFLAHCPALDLWTHGKNEKKAEKNIAEAIYLFLESCLARNVLGEVLTECGFALENSLRKKLTDEKAIVGLLGSVLTNGFAVEKPVRGMSAGDKLMEKIGDLDSAGMRA